MDNQWYYDQIKDAQLEVVEQGKKLQAFLLRKYPDKSMMSTMIIFAPGIIIITGDLRVTNNGIMTIGYDLNWFRTRLDSSYLAEKFLEQKWIPERAKDYWEYVRNDYKAQLDEWKKAVAEDVDVDSNLQPDNPMLCKNKWISCGRKIDGEVTIIDAIDEMLGNDDVFSSQELLYTALPVYKKDGRFLCPFDSSDGMGGYGYNPAEVGWLTAIHRRFSELYETIDT